MSWMLPIRTVSEANQREHWAKKHKRSKSQRSATHMMLKNDIEPMDGDIRVTLTRIAPRNLDTDNLAGSFKAIRDEVVALLGRDDNPDSGVEWIYKQRRGEPKQYAVEIELEVTK